MKYKVGDKIKIIEGTNGCLGAGGKIGIVTNKKSNNGLGNGMEGFNVECSDVEIWRIGFESKCELLEEELSAVEAIKIQAEMCGPSCSGCELSASNNGTDSSCREFSLKHPERVVEILKQYKKNHEKKPIEMESVGIVRVIECTGDIKKCVYEEELTERENPLDAKERVLKEYCQKHAGKFFTVFESICRVKE